MDLVTGARAPSRAPEERRCQLQSEASVPVPVRGLLPLLSPPPPPPRRRRCLRGPSPAGRPGPRLLLGGAAHRSSGPISPAPLRFRSALIPLGRTRKFRSGSPPSTFRIKRKKKDRRVDACGARTKHTSGERTRGHAPL